MMYNRNIWKSKENILLVVVDGIYLPRTQYWNVIKVQILLFLLSYFAGDWLQRSSCCSDLIVLGWNPHFRAVEIVQKTIFPFLHLRISDLSSWFNNLCKYSSWFLILVFPFLNTLWMSFIQCFRTIWFNWGSMLFPQRFIELCFDPLMIFWFLRLRVKSERFSNHMIFIERFLIGFKKFSQFMSSFDELVVQRKLG